MAYNIRIELGQKVLCFSSGMCIVWVSGSSFLLKQSIDIE